MLKLLFGYFDLMLLFLFFVLSAYKKQVFKIIRRIALGGAAFSLIPRYAKLARIFINQLVKSPEFSNFFTELYGEPKSIEWLNGAATLIFFFIYVAFALVLLVLELKWSKPPDPPPPLRLSWNNSKESQQS